MGILSLLLWTPIVGVVLLAFLPGQHAQIIRGLAHFFSGLTLLVSIWILHVYNQHDGSVQFSEHIPLNPTLGSAYALGIDGLSMPMVLLTTLLTLVAVLVSSSIKHSLKGYYLCVLLLEFGILGVFLTQDWAMFYAFWEITLIPLFFLIGRWGGKRRHAASLNFVLYTMGGSVFMLISLLAISQYDLEYDGTLMTSMHQMASHMPWQEQVLVLLGFLIGFGVKLPIFPLHGWLPLAHVEAPSPISILLSGVLLKMGAYGLIRVVVMLPEAAQILQPLLVFLALFGLLYGGLLAWRQTDLKAMVAYSSVSHMGIVLLGISTLTEIGLNGALLQMTAHGLIAGALFLMVGLLYERTHTRNIQDYSALMQTMPQFTWLMTIVLSASMGLPSTLGFVAELHVLIAGFERWGSLMAFFGAGMLISAAYCIRTIGVLFTGPVRSAMLNITDLTKTEVMATAILVMGIVFFGVLPESLIELSKVTMNELSYVIAQRLSEI